MLLSTRLSSRLAAPAIRIDGGAEEKHPVHLPAKGKLLQGRPHPQPSMFIAAARGKTASCGIRATRGQLVGGVVPAARAHANHCIAGKTRSMQSGRMRANEAFSISHPARAGPCASSPSKQCGTIQASTHGHGRGCRVNRMKRNQSIRTSGDMALLTGPHHTSFSDPSSLTTRLSSGERPVLDPE